MREMTIEGKRSHGENQEHEITDMIKAQVVSTKEEFGAPQFVYHYHYVGSKNSGDLVRTANGSIVLHSLPAQIDMGYDVDVYERMIICYLDSILGEHDGGKSNVQKVTVLLDVRPGQGWPNPPAVQMVGLIRHLADELNKRYPNRLEKLILYPIPKPVVLLYNVAIKPLLWRHRQLKQAMELIPGMGVGMNSPPPFDSLSHFLPLRMLRCIEEHRLACFVTEQARERKGI